MSFSHPQLQRCYDVALSGAWHHPFFLIPLGHLEWKEADPEDVPTMAVTYGAGGAGATLWVNCEWTKSLPDKQLFGVLAHEIMHPLLQHASRSEGKKVETWGKASDMAINASLVQSGIEIPPYGLLPPREHYESSAEELYAMIEAEEIPDPPGYDPNKATAGCMPQKTQAPSNGDGEGGQGNQPGQDPGGGDGEGDGDGQGQGQGQGGGSSQSDERFWGEMLAQCQAMGRGTGSAKAMAKLFARRPTKTKWARVLRNAASRANAKGGRDVQTFSRTNRRSTGDVILPGWQSQRPAIAVIVDSSGSVSDDMLRSSLSSVIECAKVSGVRFFLALHDGDCYFADWIKPETSVESLSALCGQRGGTDCNEAFEKVGQARGRFDKLVYLTDGEVGHYPDKPQNCKGVIVGIVGDRNSGWRAEIPAGWQEIPVDIDELTATRR